VNDNATLYRLKQQKRFAKHIFVQAWHLASSYNKTLKRDCHELCLWPLLGAHDGANKLRMHLQMKEPSQLLGSNWKIANPLGKVQAQMPPQEPGHMLQMNHLHVYNRHQNA
jgi:hypothetical protein